jgi:hypothetical protein
MVHCSGGNIGLLKGEQAMAEKTCAACDCRLDGNAIAVTLAGRTVEVCCKECADKLNEADASSGGTSQNKCDS